MLRLLLAGALLVGCSETALNADITADVPIEEPDIDVDPKDEIETDDTDVEPHRPDCGNTEDRRVMFARLEFPERHGCSWAEGDNLDRRNEFLRAYEQETRSIDMPTGARICDLGLASLTGDLWFDDHMTLLLQGGVIVGGGSGYPMDLLPPDPDGFVPWDWFAVRDTPFQDRTTPYWCLGGEASTCVVPPHDERGVLDIALPTEALDPFTVRVEQDASMDISLLTFGDDNDSDCSHSDVVLEATITWVQQ